LGDLRQSSSSGGLPPVVILAGGLGTRFAEETSVKPKPMIEIGGHPMLWHIMKYFGHYGAREFYIATGYKGDVIKRFFVDYFTLNGSMTIDLASGKIRRHDADCEDWSVHLIDTGPETMTGGRLRRLQSRLGNRPFMLTYGDGVCSVDPRKLLDFHCAQKRIATVTAVRPPARFGGLDLDGDAVVTFSEKPQIGEGWINGGYMVLEPQIFDYLNGDDDVLEADALERLAREGQLSAFRHDDFWQCMDTLRDKRLLERMWEEDRAPWHVWGAVSGQGAASSGCEAGSEPSQLVGF
jgi:glucose-1-phosphate cytidylyltransferase